MIPRLALLLALAAPAMAHGPEKWTYDRECCHDRDCAPVPAEAVKEAPGGYSVLVRPGQHPMLTDNWPARAFLAHGDRRIRVSGDEHKHACVNAAGTVYCVYVPMLGF